MRFPTVRYASTSYDDYLELYLFNGTYRGVIFETASAAIAALASGRAEVDCVAVMQGFMPLRATFVSGAGVAPQRAGDDDDDECKEAVRVFVSASKAITPTSDKLARLADPRGAERYLRIARSMG